MPGVYPETCSELRLRAQEALRAARANADADVRKVEIRKAEKLLAQAEDREACL